jgi:hypothetical protein
MLRDPDIHTPRVFDYLWLYWILKHYFPKDITKYIIGDTYPFKFFLSTQGIFIDNSNTIELFNGKENRFVRIYYYWWRTGKHDEFRLYH